jgi:hypothetical protein
VIVGRIAALRKSKGLKTIKPAVPEGITDSWINMSDLRDRIALDHTLEDDYQANSRGLRVRDIYVFNDYEMDGNPNPHKSFGYLRTPEMAEIIDGFLEGGRGNLYRGYRYLVTRVSIGIRSIVEFVTRGRY